VTLNFQFPAIILTINREKWESIPEVVAEANEIAKSTRNSNRSTDQIYDDAMNGLSLQYELADILDSNANYTVDLTKNKSFDFFLNGIPIDCKGMFSSEATCFKSSEWEKANSPPNTIYVCYDCRSTICKYVGWATKESFQPSKINFNQQIVYPSQLSL
jgi:hypothetical protein